eukprot:CAMPEP_0119402066 /NCGR_PEP_ID=MMETSP1334-20130426/142692_1 /TAXON_ID=127549 /ORGANISM="Calcidiscus leptoporus, Strain RCC1130" /LENGTH=399 /DNA_ID=CAMNT_0007425993 /DNA_START=11 /DNA_END=1210 /DNA_ORIENTATION=-
MTTSAPERVRPDLRHVSPPASHTVQLVAKQAKVVEQLFGRYNCSAQRALAHVNRVANTRVLPMSRAGEHARQVAQMGLGSQMGFAWMPQMVTAFFWGARLILSNDIATRAWNYGCPAHPLFADVLDAKAMQANSLTDTPLGDAVRIARPWNAAASPLTNGSALWRCRGQAVPAEEVQTAAVRQLLRYQPSLQRRVAHNISRLRLPARYAAAHLRAGDMRTAVRIRSSECGPIADAFSNASYWASAIARAMARHQQAAGELGVEALFLESDDCGMLGATAKHLAEAPLLRRLRLVYLPCATPRRGGAAQSRAWGGGNRTLAGDGHDQWSFNLEHSCDEVERLFTALAVFRGAEATFGLGKSNMFKLISALNGKRGLALDFFALSTVRNNSSAPPRCGVGR